MYYVHTYLTVLRSHMYIGTANSGPLHTAQGGNTHLPLPHPPQKKTAPRLHGHIPIPITITIACTNTANALTAMPR